jgi:hypothetical protein
LMLRESTNHLFASLYNFVQIRPVIEDRVEKIDSALETFLDRFLGSRLEEAPGVRAAPVAWRDRGSDYSSISLTWHSIQSSNLFS